MYLPVGDLVDEEDDALPVWDACKVEDLRSLVLEHDSYDVVPLPAGRQAIGSKWVVKHKSDKDKARFTPKGCAQKPNVDYEETWAPVAKLTTLRILLTIVALLQLATGQLDLLDLALVDPIHELRQGNAGLVLPEIGRDLPHQDRQHNHARPEQKSPDRRIHPFSSFLSLKITTSGRH